MFAASILLRAAKPGIRATHWRVVWVTAIVPGTYTATAAEVAFSTTLGGAQIAGFTPFASEEFPGNGAPQAFDGNPATFWNNAGPSLPQHIGVVFPSPTEVRYLKLQAGDSSGRRDRAPATFRVEYSNDGVNYTTLFTSPVQGTWGIGEVRNFSLLQ